MKLSEQRLSSLSENGRVIGYNGNRKSNPGSSKNLSDCTEEKREGESVLLVLPGRL